MDKYEQLLDQIMQEVPVLEVYRLTEKGYEGLYRNGVIYLDDALRPIPRREKLAEEYSHHLTTVGNIVDYTLPENRKQEVKARRVALEILVPLEKLLECHSHGLSNVYECSEYLDIQEETFKNALLHYHTKYGNYVDFGGKRIVFGSHFVDVVE